MCSVKQVRHIFRTNDRIYADACILMNAATLEAFFGRYGDIMKKEYSKIIIPASVRKEITKLVVSIIIVCALQTTPRVLICTPGRLRSICIFLFVCGRGLSGNAGEEYNNLSCRSWK